MDNSSTKGSRGNKVQSRQKFMDAVEEILITKGVAGLKVNDIAKVAGLDKKLIYKYFGGADQLIDAYILSKDFWSNVKGEKVPPSIGDGGHKFVEQMLLSQFDYVFRDSAFQKVLLWRLTEKRDVLQKLTDAQEANGEVLLQDITDPHFGDQWARFRAIMAILISGAYYLNLYGAVNGSTFCGINVNEESGRAEIKEAFSFLLKSTYSQL
ncbi:TetR/AcrR family transcriptional regulator [Filimonas effusa]|uniref:TetR/AcrR family transcriptional regulator n=1 Tax=Filimonas effusa TaxID=2508721 RepID=A0A4Q1DAQ3_9BACT|nr:TetR/AcrR family transcriptional regulator [Filimonas effusa]RXK85988.1 TetR/AcrR family transcriptional regulator [Filimonas effusa]